MKRTARRTLVAGAALAASSAAAIAAERYLIRRARSRLDPSVAERLAERPGIERRIQSFDGTELAVNVVGRRRGATLVFSHGFTLDMTGWHYQWKRFSKDRRCVLYDQRGHGRSSAAAGGDYSLEALGQDLKRVMDEAGPGPQVLVGHSMGGISILSLAAQFPEEFGTRVRGVVFANTAAADLLKAILGNLGARAGNFLLPQARRLASSPQRAYRVRSALLGRGSNLAYLVARLTNFGPHASPALVDYVVSVAATVPLQVWTDLMTSLVEMDLGSAMEKVTVPALVVVGDVDRLTPPSTAVALKRALPDGRMILFRSAGHCVMLERHAQFNRVLQDFLDGLPVGARQSKTPISVPAP